MKLDPAGVRTPAVSLSRRKEFSQKSLARPAPLASCLQRLGLKVWLLTPT
jgi:hypothetical protein